MPNAHVLHMARSLPSTVQHTILATMDDDVWQGQASTTYVQINEVTSENYHFGRRRKER